MQDSVRHALWVKHWRKVLCVVYTVSKIISAEGVLKDLLGQVQVDVAV